MNSTDELSIAKSILTLIPIFTISIGFITIGFGFIGTIINLLVFTNLNIFRTNHCVFYLIIESISDIIYCIYYFIYLIFAILYPNDLATTSIVWCRLRSLTAQSCALTTYFSIACMTIDQFFSTHYRLSIRQIFTVKLLHNLTYSMIITFVIHSIIFCFFLHIIPSNGCILLYPIAISYARYFFYPILAAILPTTIASLFSVLAYRNVRHIIRLQLPIERRRFDQQITAMILLRVICFVCLILPYITFRIYVININNLPKDLFRSSIVQLVQTVVTAICNLNYTINFYIFIVTSEQYRRQVKGVLEKFLWNRFKIGCCPRRNVVLPKSSISTRIHSNNEYELELHF